MKTFVVALAAASMLAAPAAMAQNVGNAGKNGGKAGAGGDEGKGDSRGNKGHGGKVGHDAKVCLVTFQEGGAPGTPASDAIRAQYLPLRIAVALKSRDTNDIQQIQTYGPIGYAGAEVSTGGARLDASKFDISNSLTPSATTEQACRFLADYADSSRDDDDD